MSKRAIAPGRRYCELRRCPFGRRASPEGIGNQWTVSLALGLGLTISITPRPIWHHKPRWRGSA